MTEEDFQKKAKSSIDDDWKSSIDEIDKLKKKREIKLRNASKYQEKCIRRNRLFNKLKTIVGEIGQIDVEKDARKLDADIAVLNYQLEQLNKIVAEDGENK